MAYSVEGRRRASGGMLPLLALSTVSEYYRLPWKPPVTAGLLAANTLVYLRPSFIDPVIPHINEVWFNPNLILKHKDLRRFFLSPFYHLDEPHLVYNMMSLLWKGIKLETSMGSSEFASMVFTLLGMSQGVTLMLAKSLHVFFDYERAFYSGILAGILYLKLKRSYSGLDPVTMVVKGVTRAVTWPLRFLSGLVRSRRRRISGRGRVGRGQSGIWRCQSCTYDNSGSQSVCEMCGSGRGRGNGWSVNQRQSHSSSSDLPLDELRRRRVERYS
ncbi:hypothetical protein Bca52824_025830 [Brassica carinata]|uniref:RanBP2-type domain-containing protein n=1 Tax=Brassica carinata TaxID=52824 RepID=A0A8X7SGX5_BRACI|nr:hypothetical protein Bca52824_025830 [Brassica carinata]